MIKWGIIGCGDVTEKKSGPAFNKVAGSTIQAVMRRNGDLARDYALRHNIPKYYTDADKLIHDPDINAVYIATPPSSHAEYAIRVMKAGKPVYVEKPMASSYKECVEMNRVSEKTGIPLYVAYYRRTLPGFLKIKEWIDTGAVGRPMIVNIRFFRPATLDEKKNLRWRVKPEIAGAGIFYDLASHQLDFLDFFFGPVTKVSGYARNNALYYSAEDTVTACFQFENKVIGSGTWCFVCDKNSAEDTVEIIGEKGRIIFSTFSYDPVMLISQNGINYFNYENPENIQYNLIEEVVYCIQNKTECISTGKSAARTNKILEEIVKGFYKKQG
jgi:predicted dehydrogenase